MPQGKRKRWLWLLLIPGIPAAVMCVLLIPIALIAGSHLVDSFVGPVNVWNSTTRIPSDAEIAGHYQISEQDSRYTEPPNIGVSSDSGFTLSPNHVLEVHDLPAFDLEGKPLGCVYNGTGKWDLYDGGAVVMLGTDITTIVPAKSGGSPSCKPANFESFAVLDHSKPHRFWYYIDDPDLGEGLMYKLR